MADTKLSALTEATVLGDTDEFYVNDSGTSKRATVATVRDGVQGGFGSVTYGANRSLIQPGLVQTGTNTTAQVLTGSMNYYQMFNIGPITVDALVIEVVTSGSSTVAVMGIYECDETWQPTSLVVQTAEFATDSTGIKTLTVADTYLPGGRYMKAAATDNAFNAKFMTGQHITPSHTTATLGTGIGRTRGSFTYSATLPSTGPAWSTVNTGTLYDPVFLRTV